MEQNAEGKKSSPGHGIFWKVVVGVLLALVVLNIYNGVALKKVEIPGLFNVEFAGQSKKTPDTTTAQSPALPEPAKPPAQVVSVAPTPAPAPLPAVAVPAPTPRSAPMIGDLSGQWESDQGATYQIQHNSNQITLSEVNPLLGVTAEGSGTLSGRNIVLDYVTVFGTTGTARLTVEEEGDTISGVIRDHVTNASTAIELYR